MSILQFTFKLLTISGCWRPKSCTSPCKRIAYDAFTCIIIFLINTFTLSQFMDLILNVKSPDDFSDNLFILLAMIISCFKLFSLLLNCKNIITMTNILTEKCKPLEKHEILTQFEYDQSIKTTTKCYFYLSAITQLCMIFSSLMINFRKRKLTYRAWLPFDYSSTMLFCLVYAHQQITLGFGGIVNVAYDSLICGLLVHICCQIEIMEFRLKKTLASSSDLFRDCVRQHCYIVSLVRIINSKFRLTIAIQFLISMLIICFSLYQLTKTTSSGKINEMALYMIFVISVMTQIFFYCWYGNKVKLKSHQLSNNIFEMEWLGLDTNAKKSLMIIMLRAAVPIQITSAYIIPMNLESFMSLLKMSFSIYNVLQQIREE